MVGGIGFEPVASSVSASWLFRALTEDNIASCSRYGNKHFG